VFFWNFISISFFAALPTTVSQAPAAVPNWGIGVIFHQKIHCIGIFFRDE